MPLLELRSLPPVAAMGEERVFPGSQQTRFEVGLDAQKNVLLY